MFSRRTLILGVAAILIYILTLTSVNPKIRTKLSSSPPVPNPAAAPVHATISAQGGHPKSLYLDQVFSETPEDYDFPYLAAVCARTKPQESDIFIKCGGIAAGMTTIASAVKSCLKLTVESGANMVLPSIPLRDPTELENFNFLNGSAYLPYGDWFDAQHLISSLNRVCPGIKILTVDQLDKDVAVKNTWDINLGSAPGYVGFQPYFWVGRPYREFFDDQLLKLQDKAANDSARDDSKTGITLITTASPFLVFRITDDSTGADLRMWNDLGLLVRYNKGPRDIIAKLKAQIQGDFYGVHFRVERDNIWSALEHQLAVDLDALDTAWQLLNPDSGAAKPPVYLACGDKDQVEKFVVAGKERGWTVTHKWALAAADPELTAAIDALPFDYQGSVDQGIMISSTFFIGIQGSAMSTTIGNARDPTGRYRGSSFLLQDVGDGGARTHLFSEKSGSAYACCL